MTNKNTKLWNNKVQNQVAATEANKVVEQYYLQVPVDLWKLLEQLKIKYHTISAFPKVRFKKIYASLKQKQDQWTITTLHSHMFTYSDYYTRFLVAHQLGHYFLDYIDDPNYHKLDYKSTYISASEETKYNVFAINLLIPNKKEFWIYKNGGKSNMWLGDYYGIPHFAMLLFANQWKGQM